MRAPPCSRDPAELLNPAVIDDPYPFFAGLRDAHPISRVGDTGVHLVASWALIDEVLGRETDFSANLTGVLVRGADDAPSIFELPDGSGANAVIATADEPHHGVHRALAQPRLAAKQVSVLEERLRSWTRDALAPWCEQGGGDFVPISEIVPARAVAHVLGLPDGDVSRHRQWAMMGGDMLAGAVDASTLSRLGTETGQMTAYLGEHLAAAGQDPRRDEEAPLLHALARGVAAETITPDVAVGIAIVMFGAGGESTAALISSAVRVLAEVPALAARLRCEPALIPRFVEEVVRLESPFKFHYRSVQRACELGGASLESGDRLMLLWAAANRDPAVFDDPDVLDLDRRYPKRHLSFGRGSHFCIGAPLARLEARVVVEELLALAGHITLRPGEAPEYAQSIFVRRLERLPLSLRDPSE